MEPITVNIALVDAQVKFVCTTPTQPTLAVAMDYVPPLGSGQGHTGLELLVMSCAGCVSTAVVALLRRVGKTVQNYRMQATGYRREEPLSLEKLDLAITVVSPDADAGTLAEAIRRAQIVSPVLVSIGSGVAVTCSGTVERP